MSEELTHHAMLVAWGDLSAGSGQALTGGKRDKTRLQASNVSLLPRFIAHCLPFPKYCQ